MWIKRKTKPHRSVGAVLIVRFLMLVDIQSVNWACHRLHMYMKKDENQINVALDLSKHTCISSKWQPIWLQKQHQRKKALIHFGSQHFFFTRYLSACICTSHSLENHFRFLFLICVQRTSKSKQLKRTHMNVIWIMVHGNGRVLGMWWRVAGPSNAKAMPIADSVRISSIYELSGLRSVRTFRCWLWCVCSPLHQINISPTPTRNEIFYIRTEIKRHTFRSIYLTNSYTIHI